MTDAPLTEAVEADYETELSRLGSSKAIYALTGGEMEPDAVEAALAGDFAAAATTFEAWPDGDGVFGAATETARTLAGALAEDPAPDPTPVHEALAALDGEAARLGGLLGWTLVADSTLAQAVGFFVGNADPQGADRVRDLRGEVQALQDQVEGSLGGDTDEAGEAAAGRVIEAAYARYVETLEGLGVKVKPVC